jgi:hypothetical protein
MMGLPCLLQFEGKLDEIKIPVFIHDIKASTVMSFNKFDDLSHDLIMV